MKLKPLDRQVSVITGASSGIGRATALMAASKGAKVVCAACGEAALNLLVDDHRLGIASPLDRLVPTCSIADQA